MSETPNHTIELFDDCRPVQQAGGPAAFMREVVAEAHRLVRQRVSRYLITDQRGIDRLRDDVVSEVLKRRLDADLAREIAEAQEPIIGDLALSEVDGPAATAATRAKTEVLLRQSERIRTLRQYV